MSPLTTVPVIRRAARHRRLLGTVDCAASTARLLNVSRIDVTEAQRLADALSGPLDDLGRLRQRLRARAFPLDDPLPAIAA